MKLDDSSISPMICKNAMPGIGCNLPEMIVLGCLFFVLGVICIYFLVQHIRMKIRDKESIFDLIFMFWMTMAIFTVYRSIIQIFPFDYSVNSLLVFHGGLNAILALIPISIFVLLICELLFTYRNPGIQTVKFYRIVFVVFLIVFLIVGISLSFIDSDSSDPSKELSLWHGCTDLIVVCFVAIPSYSLIKAISYPVVQPEDATFVRCSILGIWVFCIIFFVRSLFNILHSVNQNPATTWFQQELNMSGDRPNINARMFQFFFSLIFEWFGMVMTMLGVYYLRKHDLKFSDDPFYARAQASKVIISS